MEQVADFNFFQSIKLLPAEHQVRLAVNFIVSVDKLEPTPEVNMFKKTFVASMYYLMDVYRFPKNDYLAVGADIYARSVRFHFYDEVMNMLIDNKVFEPSLLFYHFWAINMYKRPNSQIRIIEICESAKAAFPAQVADIQQFFDDLPNIARNSQEFFDTAVENLKNNQVVVQHVVPARQLDVVQEEDENRTFVVGASEEVAPNAEEQPINSGTLPNSNIGALSTDQHEPASHFDEPCNDESTDSLTKKSFPTSNESSYFHDSTIRKTDSMEEINNKTDNDVPEMKPISENSFTARIINDNYHAFGNTLPLSQEKSKPVINTQSEKPKAEVTAQSFEAYQESRAEESSAKLLARSYQKDSTDRESPYAKRTRQSTDTLSLDTSLADEKTVAGFGGIGGNFCSTPVGKSRKKAEFSPPAITVPERTFLGKKQPSKDRVPFIFAPDQAVSPKENVDPNVASTKDVGGTKNNVSIDATMSESLDNLGLNDTTHVVENIPKAVMNSQSVNPWSEVHRRAIIQRYGGPLKLREFTTVGPLLKPGNDISLGNNVYNIKKQIGRGAFARVFLGSLIDVPFALKHESPACAWEVYICKTLESRLPSEAMKYILSMNDGFIFTNSSIIVYEFHQYGTLLDLANSYKEVPLNVDAILTGVVGVQLLRAIKFLHDAKVIHSDIKPDNVLVTKLFPNFHTSPFIKLIDFGRAIDMQFFVHMEFTGRAGTDAFDCVEMMSNRPWNYQTDYFSFVGTMHVILFGDYMKVIHDPLTNLYTFTNRLRRRSDFYEVFSELFTQFLNIPSSKELPSIQYHIDALVKRIEELEMADSTVWETAAKRCNPLLQATAAKFM